MAMQAAALGADAESGVKAAANAHPAMLSPELAEDVSFAGRCSPEKRRNRKLLLKNITGGREGEVTSS